MTEKTITFNDVPEAMSYLIEKFNRLEDLIESSVSPKDDQVQWLDIDALCGYLPDKPAKQTVYGWVCKKTMPFHKKGKKLQFLKSEIYRWLLSDESPEEEPEVFRNLPQAKKKLLKMTGIKHTDSQFEWSDWIDAQDVMQKLHISLRTLQTWRPNGILPYSRIRGKLYYRKSDILSLTGPLK